ELLKKRKFDVVLMDLHLPLLNGFETTKYIRETLMLDIPVIAITANVINGEEKKCLESGMNGFISKPYTEKDLVDKIKESINSSDKSQMKTAGAANTENAELYSISTLENICQ